MEAVIEVLTFIQKSPFVLAIIALMIIVFVFLEYFEEGEKSDNQPK